MSDNVIDHRVAGICAKAGLDPKRVVLDSEGRVHEIGIYLTYLELEHVPGTTLQHILTTPERANVLYDEDGHLGAKRTYEVTVQPDGETTVADITPVDEEEEDPYVPWSTWNLDEEILWIASYGWHRSNAQKWDEGRRRGKGGFKVYVIRDNEPVQIMKDQTSTQLRNFLMNRIAPKYRLGKLGHEEMAATQFHLGQVASISCDVKHLQRMINVQRKIEGKMKFARLDGYGPLDVFAFRLIPRENDDK